MYPCLISPPSVSRTAYLIFIVITTWIIIQERWACILWCSSFCNLLYLSPSHVVFSVLHSTPFMYSINKRFIYLSATVNKINITNIQVLFHSLKMFRTYLLIITGTILSKIYYWILLFIYLINYKSLKIVDFHST